MSENAYNNPYGLIKRFRHNEEYAFRPHKTYWTKFVIDKQERTFLSHSPSRWLIIILFYTVFYTVLACFVALYWHFYDGTLEADVPKWKMKQPGVSFSPIISSKGIEYDVNSNEEIDAYASTITNFINKYVDPKDHFEKCNPSDDYGYPTQTPCIILKVNRLYGFKTDPYWGSDLPPEAPQALRDVIDNNQNAAAEGRIWVSCESDNDNVKFTYYPAIQSVPVMMVDLAKMELYKDGSPYDEYDLFRMVAVKLSGVPLDEVVHVKCYFWAHNIERDEEMVYSKNVGKGFIKFPLKITNVVTDPN